MRILLLTNNLLFEQTLQERLHILGHETFCSESLIKSQNSNELSYLSKFFDALMLSETISESELLRESGNMQKMDIPVFRKYISQKPASNENIKHTFKDNDYHEVHSDCSLEELRESLSINGGRERIRRLKRDSLSVTTKVDLLDLQLSHKEMKIMLHLHSSNGNVVPRKKLIEEAWKEKVNNSTLSQLSIAIKRIREKSSKKNIPAETIQTIWGQGYLLEDNIYDYLSFNLN